MSFRHVACVVLALHTFVCAVSQDVPPQIPKQLEAIASNQNFSSAKTISVAVTSRRAENPDTNADLERIRRRVLERLPKIPLTVVTDKASADLWLEVIVSVRAADSQHVPIEPKTIDNNLSSRSIRTKETSKFRPNLRAPGSRTRRKL
jgi:hypothetical protein